MNSDNILDIGNEWMSTLITCIPEDISSSISLSSAVVIYSTQFVETSSLENVPNSVTFAT